MQDIKRNARELMEFLDKSPVNFFAVRTACEMLDEAGFTRLDPAESWTLRPGGRYYITKNPSAENTYQAEVCPLSSSPQ